MSVRELFLGWPYARKKKLLKDTEFNPAETMRMIQRALLDATLEKASGLPFYSSKKRCPEQDTQVLQGLPSGLSTFPVIDKSVLRKNLDAFYKKRSLRTLKATTGGSTGQPFVFFMDRFRTRQIEKAFIFDQWRRVGYKMGDSIFNLRGRVPGKNKLTYHDRLFNIFYASSFDLKLDAIDMYIKEINRIKPKFLHGYPSTMFQLASLLKQAGKRLDVQPAAVFCGSEKLFPFQRVLIEKIFQCRVYAWYGHSECLALGGECEVSHHLHFYPQYGYVELHPTHTKNSAGKEIYSIVATGFNNDVMPMIRYRTGDYAVLADSQVCECGRNYLMIEEVLGREQEFVVDFQKQLVSATSLIFGQHFSVFAGIEGLYLSQKEPGVFSITMKKNSHFLGDDFDKMKTQIKNLLGERFRVNYEFTKDLPKSGIGKAKLVQQELDIRKYFLSKEQ